MVDTLYKNIEKNMYGATLYTTFNSIYTIILATLFFLEFCHFMLLIFINLFFVHEFKIMRLLLFKVSTQRTT